MKNTLLTSRTLGTILLTFILGLPCTATAQDSQSDGERDINYLLEFVAASSCTFVRDGERFDAENAAEHLREKYQRDKRHVDSAGTFIDRVATKSSVTGKPYTVNCDGESVTTDRWLHEVLAKYRNQLDPLRGN